MSEKFKKNFAIISALASVFLFQWQFFIVACCVSTTNSSVSTYSILFGGLIVFILSLVCGKKKTDLSFWLMLFSWIIIEFSLGFLYL